MDSFQILDFVSMKSQLSYIDSIISNEGNHYSLYLF